MRTVLGGRVGEAVGSVLVAATLVLSGGSSARAEIHPYDERGFSPDLAYQTNDVDQVSLFNGALSVTVPIGQRFPLDGGLSYGFTLVYNSKLWDSAKFGNPQGFPEGRKVPNPRSNAGLGWTLTLGRLYPPSSAGNDSTTSWLYLSPDGGEHFFYSRLHADVPMPADTEYTRDGSYLRMKEVQASPAIREIEFPDGAIHRFEASQGWKLTQIRNRFPVAAAVSVNYGTPGQWIVSDSAGRTHRIYFAQFRYGDPDIPETAEMVSKVELAAFNASTATYDFVYVQDPDLLLPCAPNDPNFNGPISVPQLAQVKIPDDDDPQNPNDPQSSWAFQYYEDDGAPNPSACKTGAIRQVGLPTLGTIDYEYQYWDLPLVACSDPWDPWRSSTGVSSRTVTPGSSQPAGTWTYSRDFSPELAQRPAGYCPQAPPGIEIPREALIVSVTTPLGDESEHYFSVWPGGSPTPQGFRHEDFGLPFTRYVTDGTGTPRYLSVTQCEGSCSNPANQLRKEFVRYEDDGACVANCSDNNRRLASNRTTFLDDANHFRASDLSDFDGLGHYRIETTTGDFVSGHTRTATTDWNSGRGTYPGVGWMPPASTDPWVLGTFASRKSEETGVSTCAGGTETQIAWQEFCFDSATGFLLRERTLRNGNGTLAASRNAADVIRSYEQESGNLNGNVRFERWYGGDGGGLSTAALCSASLPAASFSVYHQYVAGVHSKSRFTDADSNPGNDGSSAPFAFWTLDRTIDSNTGLPSSVRDVSGLQTDLLYDRMARLTESKPTSANGGAWERFEYPRASGGTPAKVLHTTWATGGFSVLMAEEQTYFDGMGRVGRERHKRHDGQFDDRYTFYNENGWKDYLGEWGRASAASYGANLRNFDPFGRPREIWREALGASDVLEASFVYQGDRETQKVTGVGCVLGGGGVVFQEPVTTYERLDHFGRLIEVQEPSDGTFPGVATTYAYDVGGRLKKATTNAPGATPDQVRCWDYDRRGFLTSEKHPEKGTSGNGTVGYASYDAMGHARSKSDGDVALGFEFDAAGRLERVRETSTADRAIKEWIFGEQNAAGDYKLGKVERALGFNYSSIAGQPYPTFLAETFRYGGPGGMRSGRSARFHLDTGAPGAQPDPQHPGLYLDQLLDEFSHAEVFDARGQRIGIQYPTCVAATGIEALCPTESQVALSLQSTYSFGYLTQVPGWASSIGYHANGLWSSVVHTNGVTDFQYLTRKESGGGLDNRPRPKLLKTKLGGTTLWSSGTFVYDFAGNITAQGEPDPVVGELNHFGGVDRYLYDRVQRLRHGWLDLADPPPIVCLFCDDFETGDSCEWSETQPPAGCLLAGRPGGPRPGGPTSPQVVERDQEYVFDVYGNIQSITTDGLLVNTPTDSGTNRLVSGSGTAYDSRGNLISRPGYTFVYDALDRLVRRQASGELREYHFLYTADDERMLTFVKELPGSGGTDQFRWTLRDLGGTVLRDYVSVAGEAALCVAEDYVFRGSSLLGAREYSCDPDLPLPPQDFHYTLDHLGTPRLVTTSAGTLVEERKYFPFGEEAKPANPEGPRLRFTGHERDVFDLEGAQDDLDYLHARFYRALTGRFLSVDPAGGNPGAPQGWNRYAFVRGNPVRFVDPTGRVIKVPGGAKKEDEPCKGVVGCLKKWALKVLNSDPAGLLSLGNPLAIAGVGVNAAEAAVRGAGALDDVARAAALASDDAGRALGAADDAFHYTFTEAVDSIMEEGLRQGSYATNTSSLSPLQAQIDLALPPNRGLRDAVVRVDLGGLRGAGYDVPEFSRVGRSFNMPGGGMEVRFDYPVPAAFLQVVRP